METERQNQGEVSSATINAEAQVQRREAALAQAQANLAHQQADTTRTVALAKQGIASEQARDEAVTSLKAAQAAVETATENIAAAQAALKQARRTSCWRVVSAQTVASTRGQVQNAQGARGTGGRGTWLRPGVGARDRQGECAGGAAGRSAGRRRHHRHGDGPDADLGVCAAAGDTGRCGATRRQPARS